MQSAHKIETSQSKEFLEYFYETDTKIKRDLAILSAYKDGYTQVKIATHLKLSTSMISKIIKKNSPKTPKPLQRYCS